MHKKFWKGFIPVQIIRQYQSIDWSTEHLCESFVDNIHKNDNNPYVQE